MPTSYDGTLLDHLAKHMVYLLMLAAAANVVVLVNVVGTVIVGDGIVSVAVVVLAFVLRHPLGSFHRAGWLLPVALSLSLASLPRVPLLAEYCVCHALPWWSSR